MGKKKKKAGGDGGMRKPKKEKVPPEPTITLREAMLALQLRVKEKAVEEFTDEMEAVKFKNDRQRDRNRKLTEERDERYKTLRKQMKAYEEAESKKPRVEKEEVEAAMLAKFAAERKAIQEVADMKARIVKLDEEISKAREEVAIWVDYRDRIRHENDVKLKTWRQRLAREQEAAARIKKDVEQQLSASIGRIQQHMDYTIQQHDEQLTEATQSRLPPDVKHESEETPRLQKQLNGFRSYRRQLGAEVDARERVNIDLAKEGYDLLYDPTVRKKQTSGRSLSYNPYSIGGKKLQQATLVEDVSPPSRQKISRILSPPRVTGSKKTIELSPVEPASLPSLSPTREVMSVGHRQNPRPSVVDLTACMEGREALPLVSGSYEQQVRERQMLRSAFPGNTSPITRLRRHTRLRTT